MSNEETQTPERDETPEVIEMNTPASSANGDAEIGGTAGMARPLAMKMARVMAQVRHVPKRGRNSFHKYDYIMESDLVDALRSKLAEQGVAIFASVREHSVAQTTDNRNRVQYLATVELDVTFIDGESGDSITTTWVGQGSDSGDKGYYKAYTGAFKYALMKTFLVTGEDETPEEVTLPRRRRRA